MAAMGFSKLPRRAGQPLSRFSSQDASRGDRPIEENGRLTGARVNTPDGVIEIRAKLTVGADGRHSIVRERAGLQVMDLGASHWMSSG